MLILVPTELEARPLRERGLSVEITGMGPVEATLRATLLLSRHQQGPVVLAGIGGAYPGSGLEIGDLAVASCEFFGDLGLCYQLIETDFSEALEVEKECPLHHPLVEKALALLEEEDITLTYGPFVTVCCATRDPVRAKFLATRHRGALVENMEGFAVARVTREFGLPLLELRAVSNLLTDPEAPWQIDLALNKVAEALLCLRKKF